MSFSNFVVTPIPDSPTACLYFFNSNIIQSLDFTFQSSDVLILLKIEGGLYYVRLRIAVTRRIA